LIGYYLGWGSVFNSLLGGLAFTSLVGTIMLGAVFIVFGLTGFIIGLTFFKKFGRVICTLIGLALAIWLIFFSNVSTEPLLVNISVAELQTLNVFTSDGIVAVATRVGILPTVLTALLIPFAFYKMYKKEKINYIEIFLFIWALVSIFLISRGIRFSLLFSIAAAATSGYVIGNLFLHLKHRLILFSIVFGIIGLFSIFFLSDAIQYGFAGTSMILSQNWYDSLDWLKTNGDQDSLVMTWWDPGHIITGYTGLKAMADGAHCDPNNCIPYNHNIRIRDMGRTFSTSNETEALDIIEKYKELTPDQCQSARDKWGAIMPSDACKPVSNIYLIASSDLIGKYYWLSYFGSYNETTKVGEGTQFSQLSFSGFDSSGLPTYGNVITLMQKESDNQLFAVINVPEQGIRNAVIKDLVYYQNNQKIRISYNSTNSTSKVFDAMLWVDPSFQAVIFMDAPVRDSIFTKLFFWDGEGLKHFEMVYSNSEVKIFKVIF
jgi:dolichyl-diphosphooligosaccharide--protein glycosyltransferase